MFDIGAKVVKDNWGGILDGKGQTCHPRIRSTPKREGPYAFQAMRREKQMEKVLCATDHSKAAQKAEEFAANLAKKVGAELVYVYVSHITEKDMEPKASRSSITILKDVALKEHDVLAHARSVADGIGVAKVNSVLLRSHRIASKIIDYVKQEGIDHIVVGTAGTWGLKKLALGSVAEKIIGKAECPVTVVR